MSSCGVVNDWIVGVLLADEDFVRFSTFNTVMPRLFTGPHNTGSAAAVARGSDEGKSGRPKSFLMA